MVFTIWEKNVFLIHNSNFKIDFLKSFVWFFTRFYQTF